MMTTGIGWILQGGVLLSAVVMVLGMILLPLRPGGFSPQRVLAFPQTLSQVGAGLLILRPQAVITLGLLPLVAAPVALGILIGALLGARLLQHLSNKILRLIIVPVIVVAALEMILHGLGIGPF